MAMQTKTGQVISDVYDELDRMLNIPEKETDKVLELLKGIGIAAETTPLT